MRHASMVLSTFLAMVISPPAARTALHRRGLLEPDRFKTAMLADFAASGQALPSHLNLPLGVVFYAQLRSRPNLAFRHLGRCCCHALAGDLDPKPGRRASVFAATAKQLTRRFCQPLCGCCHRFLFGSHIVDPAGGQQAPLMLAAARSLGFLGARPDRQDRPPSRRHGGYHFGQ